MRKAGMLFLSVWTMFVSLCVYGGGVADADRLYGDGNYAEALKAYEKGLKGGGAGLEPKFGGVLENAVSCLNLLNRGKEFDALMEESLRANPGSPHLWWKAGVLYDRANHYGQMIGGVFVRGYYYDSRGSGRPVESSERDRVAALRCYARVMESLLDGLERGEQGSFFLNFAESLFGGGETWKLQELTDLSQLPDYREREYGQMPMPKASVDGAGNPVFFAVPASFKAAKNDGERWRYVLEQAAKSGRDAEAGLIYADFLNRCFGVRTLLGQINDPELLLKADTEFSLVSLSDDEMIAALANGIRRFKLPAADNPIMIYRKYAADGNADAVDALSSIYIDRMQYVKATEVLEAFASKMGKATPEWVGNRLSQIRGEAGEFLPVETQAAGGVGSLRFRYRNAGRVDLTAWRVDVRGLLKDMRSYLEDNPAEITANLSLENIGYELVRNEERKYRGRVAGQWQVELNPGRLHYEHNTDIALPFNEPGAYLVRAALPGGYKCYVVVWLTDTVIIRKQAEGKPLIFVCDAIDGRGLKDMRLECFGFIQEYLQNPLKLSTDKWRHFNIKTSRFTMPVEDSGLAWPGKEKLLDKYNWMIVAEDGKRYGVCGFQRVWTGYYGGKEARAEKLFCVSDRPAYRPGQTVKFKVWGALTGYGEGESVLLSGQEMVVKIMDPRGRQVYESVLKSDKFGGVSGEFTLPEDAVLGNYSLQVNRRGYLSFSVEEYKKPEFELIIRGPENVVELGGKFKIELSAKYYHGEAVKNGELSYRVVRRKVNTSWFPPMPWDWLYGSGYWWQGARTLSMPGRMYWMPYPEEPPFEVASGLLKLSGTGTAFIEVDTAPDLAIFGKGDYRYQVSAELRDASRRSVRGVKDINVAEQPFRVRCWTARGFYRAGDTVEAMASAVSAADGKLKGKGEISLFRIERGRDGKAMEVLTGSHMFDPEARASYKFKAEKAGRYRLVAVVTDLSGRRVEGDYAFAVLTVDGMAVADEDGGLEMVFDKAEYNPGETAKVLLRPGRAGATVLLFRSNDREHKPEIVTLKGDSLTREFVITRADMPCFYLEAVTVYNGKLRSKVSRVVVPPENKLINVDVVPGSGSYPPGGDAVLGLRLSKEDGTPVSGSVVVSVYDRALEYIAASKIRDIRKFFWGWTRSYTPFLFSNLFSSGNVLSEGTQPMSRLGCFDRVLEETANLAGGGMMLRKGVAMEGAPLMTLSAAPVPAAAADRDGAVAAELDTTTVRENFADSALWVGELTADASGRAELKFKLPENLTSWKVRVWTMDSGVRVGQGEVEFVTFKDFLLRMQTPRFLVEGDRTVLSANIHNYRDQALKVTAAIELDGGCLRLTGDSRREQEVASGGETRIDWPVQATGEGMATIVMKAVAEGASDGMKLEIPVRVHGIAIQEAVSGVVASDVDKAEFTLKVPAERKEQSARIVLNVSPGIAGAVFDALPYLSEYPYGCTEQTLNRFLPSLSARFAMEKSGVKLESLAGKQVNLNPGELGDAKTRMEQWRRWKSNPVFDRAELDRRVAQGVLRLEQMQNSNGGWGWFSGRGEYSYPHTTCQVVRGLLKASRCGVALPERVLDRGIEWLVNYQKEQVRLLKNAMEKKNPGKSAVDNIDAMVFSVLCAAKRTDDEMRDFLYRDRVKLSVYGLALLASGLAECNAETQLDMLMRNIGQYVREDKSTQTAWLETRGVPWWNWYGSEIESMATYVTLLCRRGGDGDMRLASAMVKYLLNNRKHATHWNSTRDTGLCVEALCDYYLKSGEADPDMTLRIMMDGRELRSVKITRDNMFYFDSSLELSGKEVESGERRFQLVRRGRGTVYFNAYMNCFSLEKFIKARGLDIKVVRNYYRLGDKAAAVTAPDVNSNPVNAKSPVTAREKLESPSTFKSGELIEVELVVESNNDYEYVMVNDYKPAGAEATEVRSGYGDSPLGAYIEYRDEKVCFFLRRLPRGRHSFTYRLRAEIPGEFSALPAVAEAMYAPELKANSNEWKVEIQD